jgi:hypothetical protein
VTFRITATHTFDAPLDAVEAGMTDPAFYAQLELPDVEAPEVLGREEDGVDVTVTVRMVFNGHLDAIARRIVGSHEIAWVQTVSLDQERHTGRLRVKLDAKMPITVDAGYQLTEADGVTTRVLEGGLSVPVPMLGGRAERSIGPGIQRRLDIEAAALGEWLTRR